MAVSLRRLKAVDPLDSLVAALQEDGGIVVEGLLDGEVLTRLNAELDPLLEPTEGSLGLLVIEVGELDDLLDRRRFGGRDHAVGPRHRRPDLDHPHEIVVLRHAALIP